MPANKDNPSLAERFIAPPFSVLDARQGYWQARKARWLALGLASHLGRGQQDRGVLFKSRSSQPGFYNQKVAVERRLGRKLTAAEFDRQHYRPKAGAIVSGNSTFDPVLSEIAYTWFCPTDGTVLDPFAGGSVRGLVAALTGRRYVGMELRREQIAANQDQAVHICPPIAPDWRKGDARRIDRLCWDVTADFVFSCPPYFDLERYSNDPHDLSNMGWRDFCTAYADIIHRSCARLRDDRSRASS